ncbi:MAG: 2Fe-2S iron-sulfur cluster binding domain-containing protein [Ruminococcaceae bacterium]|nr:2Fe-2S iron-sulfur cluster binding domain-containing protein [Oscillospiraceae bacterium]
MSKVNIKIEGRDYQVEENLTILEAARQCGYEIPSLCTYNHGECSQGSCRVCLVEVKGARGLVASCVYPVNEGMEVIISSPKAVAARRVSVELLLSNHSQDCQQCSKNGNCELLHVAKITGAREGMFRGAKTPTVYDDVTPSIVRDTSKCILCGRCIERCKNAHGNGVLGFINRGFNTTIGPAGNVSLAESPCLLCGQCVAVCPTGALMPKSEIDKIDFAMASGKHVVVQTAPAVRAALGEEFGMPVGTPVTGKMVAALKRLGFAKVYDTNFAADLTIMEEATELLHRVKTGGVLPMITSCSPGWINYAETYYGDLLDHISSCKSPHEMQGAILKSYYAQQKGIDPKDIFVVSIMPCTAKKFEKERPQLRNKDGLKDVDAVLTVRELGDMIKRAGILFTRLPDEEFDADLMGDYSGAGVIFGVTGGVMEAALRTAYFVLEGKEHEAIKFEAVRGFEGIKEASLTLGGMTVNIAVASGMKNAKVLLDDIRAGKSKYHFIEIMCCPGGCINGGGMPIVRNVFLPDEGVDIVDTYRQKRADALYSEDERNALRQSHNNAQVKELYEKFLGEPCGHLSHELLHTTYEARAPFRIAEK